jgi:hypothetical protein
MLFAGFGNHRSGLAPVVVLRRRTASWWTKHYQRRLFCPADSRA